MLAHGAVQYPMHQDHRRNRIGSADSDTQTSAGSLPDSGALAETGNRHYGVILA
jgi:hypothetical protein